MLGAGVTGFATGFSLILAIGAQNAFVLRQGLMRAHVFWICLFCGLSDAVLISAGVMGMGALVRELPGLESAMRWGGAAFLLVYGAMRLRAALSSRAMNVPDPAAQSLWAALATALAFTWLNPHVYIDTLALMGAISTGFTGSARVAFGVGAVTASFVFFFGLGYGARLLAPVFARPRAWRMLDLSVAGVMWSIAAMLLAG